MTPQLLPFIRALDERARKRSDAPKLAIWDAHDVIHMAHMDIHSSAKVNGVAELHTEILKIRSCTLSMCSTQRSSTIKQTVSPSAAG